MILKSTLTSIGHLAMLSDNPENSLHEKCLKIIKDITDLPFVDCGVPRALLTAIIESNKSSIKALSLRALATVCVNGDAVKQFEEVFIKQHNINVNDLTIKHTHAITNKLSLSELNKFYCKIKFCMEFILPIGMYCTIHACK